MASRRATPSSGQPSESVILWHPCDSCGELWPFPYGDAPTGNRSWRCAQCVDAATTRAVRQVLSATRYQVRHVPGRPGELIPDPDGRWVDADEIAEAMASLVGV